MRTFTHGDRVKVYEDPLTETKLEGEAMVLTRVATDAHTKCALLRVRFYSDRQTCDRWISLIPPSKVGA